MDELSVGGMGGPRGWPRHLVVIAVVAVLGLVAGVVVWRHSADNEPAMPVTVAGLAQCELHGCVLGLVDTATGVLDMTSTDLAADRVTGEADVARRYRSDSTASGLFGVGWSSVTETRLERTPDAWRLAGGLGIPSAPSRVTAGPTDDQVVQFVDGTAWTFDSGGLLTAMRSPGGEETRITRTTGEIRLETPLGASVRLVVGAGGRVSSAVSAAGTATFSYDGDRLSGVSTTPTPSSGTRTSPADATRISSYSYRDGHLSEVTEPARTVSVVYGPRAAVERVTQDGQSYKMAYPPLQATEVLPPGATKPTLYAHDNQRRLVSIRQGSVVVLEREFNADGSLRRQVDSSGATGYEWAAGQPVKVTKGEWVTELGYDPEHRLSTIQTPDGSTTYSYDGPLARYPSQVTNPGGGVTQLSYEGDRIARQVDADGVETKIGWALGEGKVDVAAGSDPVASLRLTEDGAVRQLDVANQPAGGADDPLDSLEDQQDQASLVSATAGDDGQPTGFDVSNSTNKLTGRTFAYDDYGRIAKIDSPSESVTVGYDDRGRVASRSTGVDRTETYKYDDGGHLVETRVNGSVTMTASYDNAGRVIDQTVNGENVKHSYDPNGLVSELTDYRGTWKVTRTKAGKAQSITAPNGGTVDFAYDGGRLSRVGTPTGASTTYHYDEAGRIERLSRGGVDVTYGYRDDDKLGRITSPLGIDNFGYDDKGRLNTANGPSGTWAVDYDSKGRPAQLSEDSGLREFAYDDLGRVSAVVDTPQGEDPVRTDYRYDDRGRLSGTTRDGQLTGIEYGADGRPSQVSIGERSEKWQWTPAGYLQRITAAEDTYDFNYDNNRIKTIQRNNNTLINVDWNEQGPSTVAVEDEQLATLKWDNSRLSELTFDRETLTIERNGDGELSKLKIGDQVRTQVDWNQGIPTRTYSDDGEAAFNCTGTDCEFSTGPLTDGQTDAAAQVRLSYRAGVLTEANVDGTDTKFQANPLGQIRGATRGDGDDQKRGEVTPSGEITGDLTDLLTAVVGTDGVPNGPSTRTQFATIPIVDSLPTELRPDGLDLDTPADQVQRTISTSIPTAPALRALDDDDTDIAISVLRDILTDTQVSVPFGPFGERNDDMFDDGDTFHQSGLDTDMPSVLSDDGWGAQFTQLSNALRPDPGLLGVLIEWGPTILGTVVGFVTFTTFGWPAFLVVLGVAGIAAAGACFFEVGSCAALSDIAFSFAQSGPLGQVAQGSGVAKKLIAAAVEAAVAAGQAYVDGGDLRAVGTAFALGIVLGAAGPFAKFAKKRACNLAKVVCYSRLRFPETAPAYKAADGHRPARLLTVDRGGATSRRKAALAGTPTKPGFDRDEYPFAITRQGGAGATITYVTSSENRSAGAYLRNELKDIEDGERFLFVVTDASSVTQRALDSTGLAASRSLRTEAFGTPPG